MRGRQWISISFEIITCKVFPHLLSSRFVASYKGFVVRFMIKSEITEYFGFFFFLFELNCCLETLLYIKLGMFDGIVVYPILEVY